ncbi:TSUP family transporter [Thermaurantiacus sp.]
MTPAIGLAALGGAGIALPLGLFGGGGSVLATPWLVLVVGESNPHVAIGTGAAAVAAHALFALVLQARAGRVKWPCALLFGAAGLAGALAGAQLAKEVPGGPLLLAFAVAMAAVGLAMFRSPRAHGEPDVRIDGPKMLKLAPAGLLVGLASGFFGIGGGFLIVPGLMAATGMTLANAAASSLVSVALFGAATSASYAASGLVDWPVAAGLVAGGLVGALLAMPLARRLAARALLARRLFAALILLTAALVAARALSA